MREPMTDLKGHDGATTGVGEPPVADALPAANLPAVIPAQIDAPAPRRWGRPLLLLALLAAGLLGGLYWWLSSGTGLPAGITSANGGIEADEIDIDTKFAGRIAEVLADEGRHGKSGSSACPHGCAGSTGLARQSRSPGAAGAAGSGVL